MYKRIAELVWDGWWYNSYVLHKINASDAASVALAAKHWQHVEILQQEDGKYIVVLPKATQQDILNAHPYPTLEAAMAAGMMLEKS